MSGWCVLAAAAMCWAAVSGPAAGQCNYEVVEPVIQGPNCPFSGPEPTFALGMNNLGEVVGRYWDCNDANINHAFVWRPGEGLTTLPTPDGVNSAFASDINDAGYIIGGHRFPFVGWKGFIRHPVTGEYTYLDALHDDLGALNTVSTANAINNNNAIAGSRVISAPGQPVVSNAVIWHPFGIDGEGPPVLIDLGVANGPDSIGLDITANNAVVGWAGTTIDAGQTRAILWQDGNAIDLGVLPGAIQSFARAINDAAWIVGGSGTGQFGPVFAVVWINGNPTEVPVPSGYATISLQDVNANNQIVGSMRLNGSSEWHPFIWQHGTVHNLLDLLVDLPSTLIVERGRRTNNAGAILARASFASRTVGAMLSPVDTPLTDLNSDCVTDIHDLLLLLGAWGPCKADYCPADFTGSGSVGVPDLLILLSNWG